MSATMVSEPGQLELVVHRLLNEAKEQEYVERRGEQRFPYFQPGTLTYRYRPEERIPIFTREISNSGIGLLHSSPLERGEVAVTLNSHAGPITFRTYIVWCKPCGPMYLSGGQFLVSQG